MPFSSLDILILYFIFPYSNCMIQMDCPNNCPPGTRKVVGECSCANCVAGKTTLDFNLHECFDCDGRSNSIEGQPGCFCNPGFHLSVGLTCVVCKPGKYKASLGNEECIDCASGKYSDLFGSITEHNCQKCNRGKFNTYTGMNSSIHCQDCPIGKSHVFIGATSEFTCKKCEC